MIKRMVLVAFLAVGLAAVGCGGKEKDDTPAGVPGLDTVVVQVEGMT